MDFTRRKTLAAGSTVVTGLAGCQRLAPTDTPQLDLELVNYTARPQPIQVSLLHPENSEFSEAQVFCREFTIPKSEANETANRLIAESVADRDRYLVRAVPKFGAEFSYHYHYYPGESSTDPAEGRITLRVYEKESEEGVYVRFN